MMEQSNLTGDSETLTSPEVDAALARHIKEAALIRRLGRPSTDLIAVQGPDSTVVEPIRALRSELTFAWLQKADYNALAVVSAERREGRSWLAANLAVAFAQTGKRVLLIDADLQQPRQHQLFHLDNANGLTSLLVGRDTPKIISEVHSQPNLSVLTAGSLATNSSGLLAGAAFGTLVDCLAAYHDLLLFDTPAAAESSDAQLIAGQARFAVVLARCNRTRQSNLALMMRRLQNAAVNIVGCVLNEY
jgi:protein-tyrosine kinase